MNFFERNAFFTGDGYYLKTNSPSRGWIEIYTNDKILIGIGNTFSSKSPIEDTGIDLNGFHFIVYENKIEVRNLCRGMRQYTTDPENGERFYQNRFWGGWEEIYDIEKFKEFINSILLSIRYVNDFKIKISELKYKLDICSNDTILKRQIENLEHRLTNLNIEKNYLIHIIEQWNNKPLSPSDDLARYFIWKSKGEEYANYDINSKSRSHFWFIYDERKGELVRTQYDRYEDVIQHKLIKDINRYLWKHLFIAAPKNLNLGVDLAIPDKPIMIEGLDFNGLIPRILLCITALKNENNIRYEYEKINITYQKVLDLPNSTSEHDITSFCINLILLQANKIAEYERLYSNIVFTPNMLFYLSYSILPACNRTFDELIEDILVCEDSEEYQLNDTYSNKYKSHNQLLENTEINTPIITYYVWKDYINEYKSPYQKVWYIFNVSENTLEKVFDSNSNLLLDYLKIKNNNSVQIIAARPNNFHEFSDEFYSLSPFQQIKVEKFNFSGLVKKIIYFVSRYSFGQLENPSDDMDCKPISKSILFSEVFNFPDKISINDNIIFNENVLKIKDKLLEYFPDMNETTEYFTYKKIFYTYDEIPACNLSFHELFIDMFNGAQYFSDRPFEIKNFNWDSLEVKRNKIEYFIDNYSYDIRRAFQPICDTIRRAHYLESRNKAMEDLLEVIRRRREGN